MTGDRSFSHRWDRLLWELLGAVELTYHPLLVVSLLAVADVGLSQVPVITLSPVAVQATGRGIPVTRFLGGIVAVDLLGDLFGVYVAGLLPVAWSGRDE